ncbi:metallophosphoesterase family protein [Halobacterium salinarum]|uniref:Phosphoesterase n=1 Tax=Halobacterium salinarum TaxID=2242 RepID=A0A841HEW6_HALSI|nr:metallophosphoesterase family protein [Halobacterium salinarum]MBB6090848.1 putative phosphoesterase [Halobacterium salinarum]MDL0128497.1 metallophosphoesterase family protein [Halobacterium salinarum]
MKIGLISDIHANLPALEAVLQDMPTVDELVCVGDVIGYNPMPSECVTRIRGIASTTVQGNHDRTVETPDDYRLNEMAHAGLEYAQQALSDAQRRWLQTLPETTTIADGEYLLVHSHPENRDEYVYPREFPDLRPYLDDYAGLILGHTHIQHSATIDNRLIVNPGSVGQPRDGDRRAAYAILDTDTNQAMLRRVPYNIDEVYHEIVVEDLPTETGERLFDGK